MPREEVDEVWAFPGVRREGREYGVAGVTRRGTGGGGGGGGAGAAKLVVYRARYTLQLKGQDRGKIAVELEETADAPGELVPRVIEGVRRRADEAGEAERVDLGRWKADRGGQLRP